MKSIFISSKCDAFFWVLKFHGHPFIIEEGRTSRCVERATFFICFFLFLFFFTFTACGRRTPQTNGRRRRRRRIESTPSSSLRSLVRHVRLDRHWLRGLSRSPPNRRSSFVFFLFFCCCCYPKMVRQFVQRPCPFFFSIRRHRDRLLRCLIMSHTQHDMIEWRNSIPAKGKRPERERETKPVSAYCFRFFLLLLLLLFFFWFHFWRRERSIVIVQ